MLSKYELKTHLVLKYIEHVVVAVEYSWWNVAFCKVPFALYEIFRCFQIRPHPCNGCNIRLCAFFFGTAVQYDDVVIQSHNLVVH